MKTEQKKLVLFDFDGVIADTFGFCYELSQQVYDGITVDEYAAMFEGNFYSAARKRPQRVIDYWGLYVPRLMQARVFPGIEEALTAMENMYTLSVVSSSISSPINEYLQKHNLGHHFDDILGKDVHASKVEKVTMMLKKHQVSPANAVFVTDTLGDMLEAAKCEVGSIAVSYGFHREDRLKKGNPFKIIDSPTKLPGAINEYFNYAAGR